MELKIAARKSHLSEIKKQGKEIRLLFKKNAPVEPDKIISLVTKRQQWTSLLPEGGIAVKDSGKSLNEVFELLIELLIELQ